MSVSPAAVRARACTCIECFKIPQLAKDEWQCCGEVLWRFTLKAVILKDHCRNSSTPKRKGAKEYPSLIICLFQ